MLRDFGDRNQKEDPVMHFFEGFLQEYDRKDRTVFYTPQPVALFHSVDEKLRIEFGFEDGLLISPPEVIKRERYKIPHGISPNDFVGFWTLLLERNF